MLEIGRYTLPATGVMLVMVPDGAGGHDWKPATTLGFAYRLFDFVPPMHKTPVSLHINIARTHISGIHDERIDGGIEDINFVGFSVSGRDAAEDRVTQARVLHPDRSRFCFT